MATPAPSVDPPGGEVRRPDRSSGSLLAEGGRSGGRHGTGRGGDRRPGERNEPLDGSSGRPVMPGRVDDELVELVGSMAQGDDTALAAFYDATSARIYGFVLRVVRDPSAAEDVTIDVYAQAFRQAESYDPRRGTPWGWLLNIARSRSIDRLRAERRRAQREESLEVVGEIADTAPDPEAASDDAQRGRLVRAALASLPPDQRQVIEIAYFSGLSHSEIAARLRQPVGTVKTRIRAGMMRLRRSLTPLLFEGRT